jgi:DNA topoisomerase I
MAKTTGKKTASTSSASAKGKSLVIVESPAKAKTINKYLGDDFIVRSSIGHVRDLPTSSGAKKKATKADEDLTKEEKAQQALVRRMGIDPEHGWKAVYEVLPSKTKVIKELKALAKDADKIYLATDLDREGEAIAITILSNLFYKLYLLCMGYKQGSYY